MEEKKKYSNLIKEEAKRLGFNDCGIAKIDYLKNETIHLKHWLHKKMNGEMAFMANHLDKRSDPRLLFNGAKSIISVILSYFPKKQQADPLAPKIAKYAYGKDYHVLIKNKLYLLKKIIDKNIGRNKARVFIDTGPVMDKAWAVRAGLGCIGKNSLLLTKKFGSFVFIGELITNLDLEYDIPLSNNLCKECTKCIDACPTNAIISPKIMNASSCISYFTIEKKGSIPKVFKNKFAGWIFGCDICQDVCPWNQNIPTHKEPYFDPHPDLLRLTKKEWEKLTKEKFNTIFKGTPIKRIQYKRLIRNLNLLPELKSSH